MTDVVPPNEISPPTKETPTKVAPQTTNTTNKVVSQPVPQDVPTEPSQLVPSLKLSGATKLRNKLFGKPKATEEELDIRRALIKLSRQQESTTVVLQSGMSDLVKLAETNDSAKHLVNKINDPERAKRLDDLRTGKEISPKKAIELIDELQDIENDLKKIGISFDVKFSDIVSNMSEFIKDSRIDLGSRRDALGNVVQSSKLQGVQSESLTSLENILKTNVNLTKEQVDTIGPLLDQLREDTIKQDIKTRGTLLEINKKFGGLLNVNGETRDLLEKQTKEGSSIKDFLKKGGLPSSENGQGLLSAGLSALGLPGLETLLPTVLEGGSLAAKGAKGLYKGAKGAVGLFGKGANLLKKGLGFAAGAESFAPSLAQGADSLASTGSIAEGGSLAASNAGKGTGLLSKASKFGGKFLGGASKLLGKAALPLAIATAGYSFYKGFSDPNKIAGLKDGEEADTGTKVKAGAASALSDLTLGIVDPETIFKGITTGIDFLFGKDGILTKTGEVLKKIFIDIPGNALSSTYKFISEGISGIFGEDGLFSKAKSFLKSVFDASPLGMILKLFNPDKDEKESKSLLDRVKDLMMKIFEYSPLGLIYKFGEWLLSSGNDVKLSTDGKQTATPIETSTKFTSTPIAEATELSSKAANASSSNVVTSKETLDAIRQGVSKPQVIPMQSQSGGGNSTTITPRVTSIDDNGMAYAQGGIFE